MREIVADAKLVAFCELYCGACKSYLKDRCPACHENKKAAWCKVRTCCLEAGYSSCAECKEFEDAKQCKKFHNFISKIIGFVLRSDRAECTAQIKEIGMENHAKNMAERKSVTIKPG